MKRNKMKFIEEDLTPEEKIEREYGYSIMIDQLIAGGAIYLADEDFIRDDELPRLYDDFKKEELIKMTKVKDAPAADETIDEKAKNGKGTIWINVHKDWVKENIPFTDKKTGEAKTFNRVIIPPGTVVDGKDVSFYEFSPKFVNQNKFNANMRSIPVREDFTYTLSRTVRDENGRFVKDENGNYKTEQMKGVKATDLQAGMEKQRKEYLNSTRSVESLDDKAKAAKEQAKSQDKKEHDAPVNDKEK